MLDKTSADTLISVCRKNGHAKFASMFEFIDFWNYGIDQTNYFVVLLCDKNNTAFSISLGEPINLIL